MNRVASSVNPLTQCQRPSGLLGRFVLWSMNRVHSRLTDWGLTHVPIPSSGAILDVGCGGGRTIDKLAGMSPKGRIFGIDVSETSVAAARGVNRRWIAEGRVDIRPGAVEQLPFDGGTFDLVTGVETHFWWADLDAGMREIHRVLKPGGRLVLIAEIYNGGIHGQHIQRLASATTMKLLTLDEHRDLFVRAGFADLQLDEDVTKGWVCCWGKKPTAV